MILEKHIFESIQSFISLILQSIKNNHVWEYFLMDEVWDCFDLFDQYLPWNYNSSYYISMVSTKVIYAHSVCGQKCYKT